MKCRGAGRKRERERETRKKSRMTADDGMVF
jgi:hypothetical protein